MQSTGNVVVLLRLCGRVFAVTRRDDKVRVRKLVPERKGTKPPDQTDALKLLRKD